MQQNMDTPYTVAELAQRMAVNKRQLERRFQATLQTSPMAACTMIRLEHARFLVQQSERSIAAIATESGFCDASHLSRAFRKRFGETPLALRLKGNTPKPTIPAEPAVLEPAQS
jgi:transcriptional regulator GlxA family with amidase domain